MTHHSIMSYQEKLATYMEALARELPVQNVPGTSEASDPCDLFRSTGRTARQDSGSSDVGRAVGGAAQVRHRLNSYKKRVTTAAITCVIP